MPPRKRARSPSPVLARMFAKKQKQNDEREAARRADRDKQVQEMLDDFSRPPPFSMASKGVMNASVALPTPTTELEDAQLGITIEAEPGSDIIDPDGLSGTQDTDKLDCVLLPTVTANEKSRYFDLPASPTNNALPSPPTTSGSDKEIPLETEVMLESDVLDETCINATRNNNGKSVQALSSRPRQSNDNQTSSDRNDESDEAPTRRGRRPNIKRKSYIDTPIDSGSDEDPLVKPRLGRRYKKPLVDSDFEEASAQSAEGSEEASEDIEDEDDDRTDSDDMSDIVGSPKRKPLKRNPVAKPATTDDGSNTVQKMSKSKKRMLNLGKRDKKGLRGDLPPMFRISDIFDDITSRSLDMGMKPAVKNLKGHTLRVATMCSGTESPLLAMGLTRDTLQKLLDNESFDLVHLFSAEIEPFKQAYIERNFAVPIIFRDITELTSAKDTTHKATTAYGSKVDIPDRVDLLIAGTACVDFSGLNAHKKDLADKGESGDTFRAVLQYAKLWRPRILILENVFNAPWDDMLDLYEKEDYATGGVLADTKNFYLPQTRQRGYMVCLDRRAFKNATKKARKWEAVMEHLKRPASSPVTDFLLPNDDPTVISARMLRARNGALNNNAREVDWSKCAIRHIQYRRDKNIGNARPFTSWQESGTVSVPDYADREWHAKQVERIWDMQDCSILRKALPEDGNYDAQFKTRVWDLSQGVDRFTDTAPFGISSCLTPTGIFYLTDRGGPITHHESLILQGLPIDRISFTTETGANIQDLAGNAMSSTVVGSAIVAAIVAGYEDERPSGDAEMEDIPEMIAAAEDAATTGIATCDGSQSTAIKTPAALDIDLQQMMRDASDSARKCACEGPNDIAPKSIQICDECGHTSCLSCGNKPVHHYGSKQILRRERTLPVSFSKKWASQLPSQFKFEIDSASVLARLEAAAQCGQQLKKGYFECLKASLQSTFSYEKFHRGRSWIITYVCPVAELRLVVGEGQCQWQLFAKPSADLPASSPLRHFLQRPVALANVKDGQWTFRIPSSFKTNVSIAGQGERVASWMARLNLPAFTTQRVWQELVVQPSSDCKADIGGTYRHLPQCGTACESLYKRIDAPEGTPACFMLLDPDSIGEASEDSVVFASDPERMSQGHKRLTLLRLDSSWRPWAEGKKFSTVDASLDEAMIALDVDQVRIQAQSIDLKLVSPTTLSTATQSSCGKADMMFSVTFPDQESADNVLISESHRKQDTSVATSDKSFFLNHGWVFQPVNAHLNLDGWQTYPLSDSDHSCQRCVPAMPSVRWRLGHDGRSLRPYEDSASATSFERCLKHRPDLFSVLKHKDADSSKVTVGLDVASLAHRALGKLQQIDDDKDSAATVSWAVDPAYTESSSSMLPSFSLISNDRDKSFDDPLDLSVELWPKQRQSLAWMLAQERDDGALHNIEEAAEAQLPHLNWRAEARASRQVTVRGGIQASHPGFGKTICTLALVQSDYQKQGAKDILASMKELPVDNGAINIAATLILAPKHLVKQWRAEVDKVLQNFGKMTIMIQTAQDLSKYKVQQFRMARIIIVNQEILTSDSYIKRLAQFAGIPEPAATKGREYKTWLAFAIRETRAHLKILETQGAKALAKVIETKFKAHLDDETFQAIVPSKRLKGRAYAEKDWGETGGKGKKKVSGFRVDPDIVDKCLFEMFNFNRIVVDEFTYLNAKDYASVQAMQADKRWALSATARLQDPYDIARMASLIGVKLRVGENASGALSARNLKVIRSEMTDFELFQTFRDAPSAAVTGRTYELAQTFLDSFVRQNILEFDDFPYADHVSPVTIDLSHRVVYTELSQHLNSQDMRIKKGRKNLVEERDRDNRLFDNLKDVESAEEALSRLAAIFHEGSSSQEQEIAALVTKREREHKSAEKRLQEAIMHGQKASIATKSIETPFEVWKASVTQDDAFGDEDTTMRVVAMIEAAEEALGKITAKASKAKAGKNGASDDEGADSKSTMKGGEALKEHVSHTNQLSKQYLATGRSIRFVKNAHSMQSTTADHAPQCESQNCSATTQANLAVSALCGHLVCSDCLVAIKANSGLCLAAGCRAPVQDYHLLRANKLAVDVKENETTAKRGSKVDAVLDLLAKIQTNDEQAILFVRYESQIGEMEKACRMHSPFAIRCTAVRDNNSAAQLVTEFQTQTDTATRSTVIVLNASNASAAGVNLTNANHVLFLSPLLTDTQYDYEAAMAQAVGRVRRPGQTRDICVYRFVALDTIDVDILEHRERRDMPLSEQGAAEVKSASEKISGADRERCQMIRGADGVYRLMPKSWLVGEGQLGSGVEGRARIRGYEDFSSLVKFSKAYSEDD